MSIIKNMHRRSLERFTSKILGFCDFIFSHLFFVFLNFLGNSLVVQWLGLCASIAGGAGLIPGRGTKIPQAMQAVWCDQQQNKAKQLSTVTFFSIQEKNTTISFRWCGSCPCSVGGNASSGYFL